MAHEIDFLPVGDAKSGDAICIRYSKNSGGYAIHLVDGGYTDTAETIIKHIDAYYEAPHYIDHVVLSHADNDHACGLIGVLEHYKVGALWMNRPWLYAAEIIGSFHGSYTVAGLETAIRDAYPFLVELEEIATEKGIPIYEVFQGTQIGAFQILAPSRQRYLRLIPDFAHTPTSYAEHAKGFGGIFAGLAKAVTEWVQEFWGVETLSENPEPTSASNESCVVQAAQLDGDLTLLTADVGPEGLREAAEWAQVVGLLMPPALIQVPHHGSRRNVTPSVLDMWMGTPVAGSSITRGAAVCSAGKNDSDHPRKKVTNAFLRRGYPVYTTEGTSISHRNGMPSRGWGPATSKPFYNQVED